MRRLPFTKAITAVLITSMSLLPIQQARAVGPVSEAGSQPISTAQITPIRDIELGPGGVLGGQLLDAQGLPQKGQPVRLQQDGRLLGQTMTDVEGHFVFEGLRGGLYEVATVDAMEICRCWMPHTAPPTAEQQVLLVAGQVNRGQRPFHHILANPLVIGILIAAAIAIPIAVHNARKDRPSGS